MRSLFAASLMGSIAVAMVSFGAQAEPAMTRVASMPYTECLSIIAEASEETGAEPVRLVSTDDQTTVRINAEDGFVTVSCNRGGNKMTLTRSPVPGAAGMTASR